MKTTALFALLLLQLGVKAQSVSSSVINTSGSTYSQGFYSLDWSVGEGTLVTVMKSGDGLIVISNGFLQPDLPVGNTVQHFTNEEVKILPNPTYQKVEINLATKQQGVLRIYVYDTRGRLVINAKSTLYGVPIVERLDLTPFSGGTYFVKLELEPAIGSHRKTGSYKIVKL